MSEDQRVSRADGEPAKSGPEGAARWADYLDWLREDVIAGVLALSEAQQRTPRVTSGWSPIELLSHVLHMEQRWFVWGFLAEEVDEPWGDWNTPEPWTADDAGATAPTARWVVPEDVTAVGLSARLRALGARTRAILAEHPMGDPGRSGGRFGDDPPTLEWICFHVVAEYARHAGHLDIVAELAADDPADGDTGSAPFTL